jgi:hypothetical protein
MGGATNSNAPINEAINLIAQVSPDALKELQVAYSFLGDEVKPGLMAGDAADPDDRKYLLAKAAIIRQATDAAIAQTKAAQQRLRGRIARSNRVKLAIQVIGVVASASVLGTIITDKGQLSMILSITAVIVSISTLVSDQYDRLLNPNSGNIYDAFDKVNSSLAKAIGISRELELLETFARPNEEMKTTIAEANSTMQVINELIPEIM